MIGGGGDAGAIGGDGMAGDFAAGCLETKSGCAGSGGICAGDGSGADCAGARGISRMPLPLSLPLLPNIADPEP
jgi:hypothetical protein